MDTTIFIKCGNGGIDSVDFARMLVNMYSGFCLRKRIPFSMEGNFLKVIQPASFQISLYGVAPELLKYETGVHRLVRFSPFDSEHRRHTSFCLVEIDNLETNERKSEGGWHSAVRSYVFDPLPWVMNHLNGAETDKIQDVLNGDFNYFLYRQKSSWMETQSG